MRGMRVMWLLCSAAFSLVGADEHTHKYKVGEEVVLWMNTIGPYSNRQETYTYFSLPFCQGPLKEVGHYHETIGEALQGVELQNSGAAINFKDNESRKELCTLARPTDAEVKKFRYAVANNYVAQMYMDDLPIMAQIGTFENQDGSQSDHPKPGARYFLWAHRRFEIAFNADQIVGVTMEPEDRVELIPGQPITFTYSVDWVESNIPYSDRFDRYLDPSFFQHKIHWFSLFNSFMMVLFLVGLVVMILLRTLRRDFARYSRDEPLDELERDLADEYGWKQVHADVFRPPAHPLLFAVLIGSGLHLFTCAAITLVLATAGDMYEGRGETLTAVIFVYAGTALVGGFVGASLYSQLGGKRWIRQMVAQACLFPSFVCGVNFLINFVAVSYESTRAIPFLTMVKISALGLFVVLPLTLVGAILGKNTRGTANWPCRINPVPRQIPESQWYLDPLVITLMGGLLPFASIYIEMYFVFTSFWAYKIYYMYYFMMLVFGILLIVTVCVDIVCIYFLLNGEDYRWWWVSYTTAASTGIYVFLYSIYYFYFRTKMYGFFQTVFYFSYTTVLCVALAMMTGAIGHVGSSLFVRKIYQNIKID